jgi:hypothetical protein
MFMISPKGKSASQIKGAVLKAHQKYQKAKDLKRLRAVLKKEKPATDQEKAWGKKLAEATVKALNTHKKTDNTTSSSNEFGKLKPGKYVPPKKKGKEVDYAQATIEALKRKT